MANRVSPNPNDDEARKIAAEAAHKAELQRVNKVEAVDPDQRAKQNKFRNLMQPSDEENDGTSSIQAQPQNPSPAQPAFYKETNTGINPSLAIPSPTYSPSPNVSESMDSFGLSPEDPYSDEGLPQSLGYYQSTDLPWEPISSPQFQEGQVNSTQPTNQPAQEKQVEKEPIKSKDKERPKGQIDEVGFFKKAKTGPIAPPKKEEKLESLFGPPGKPIKQFGTAPTSKKGETHPSTPLQHKTGEEPIQPTGRFWSEEKIQPLTHTAHPGKKEPERKVAGTAKVSEPETRSQEKKTPAKPFEPVLERTEKEIPHEQEKGKGTEVKKGTPDFVSPSLTTLPSQILPAVDAAAVAATPYIRPEVQALYHQMVGTIMIMAKPSGVSRTEFLLNNPAFSNSKFYGASIEITRYSTAPDAFNIRLTGTTEAVNAFNQSIPGLMAAFQNGNFKFQINRIEAEHSLGKPTFHRKEADRDNSDKGEKGK